MAKRRARDEGGLKPESYVKGQTLPTEWSSDVYGRWLFNDFLYANLDALTPGKTLGIRADSWAFVRPELVEQSWEDDDRPPVGLLKTLQQTALDGIDRVIEGEWFHLEKGIAYGIAKMDNGIIRGSQRGRFEDLFQAAVMDIVQDHWQQLSKCPQCKHLFLKTGKRRFCSELCGNRAHYAKYQSRRGNRDHHEEYVVKMKKIAPGAVVRKTRRKKGGKP
jgi:hypothetical protein